MYLDISIFTYTYTDIRPLTYAYWCVSRSSYKQSLHTDHPWNMGRRKLIDLRVLSLTCHGHYINGSKLFQDTSREFISNHNVTEKNAHASEHNVIYDICDILSSYFEAINCLVRMRMLTVKNEFSLSTQMLQASRPRCHCTKVCTKPHTTRSSGIAATRAAGRKSLEVAMCDSLLRASGHVIYDACWVQQKPSEARCNGERWNSPRRKIMVADFALGGL